MKLQIILLVCALFMSAHVFSQCPVGNISINSQADADNYALNFSNCDTLTGDLTIFGFDIQDLSGFADLDVIEGDLNIENSHLLWSLSGLDQLDHVGGDVYLFANTSLQSLNGLGSLDRVEGDVFISSCDSLRDAYGLGQLDVVGGKLQFFSLQGFDLAGLNDLDSVYGNCFLIQTDMSSFATVPNDLKYVGGEFKFGADNATNMNGGNSLTRVGSLRLSAAGPAIQSISGFNALQVVDSIFSISYNASLTNLSGFNALDSVGYRFTIGDNPSLISVNGFSDLDYAHRVQFMDNATLTSINGFDHAIDIPDHLQISFNPMLNYCHVQAVCEHIDQNLSTSIHNNASDCGSTSTVYGFCLPTQIEEQDHLSYHISVYPNPSNGETTISGLGEGLWQHEIIDPLGRVVMTTSTSTDQATIDLSELRSGTYAIVSRSKEKKAVTPIVIR